MLTGSAREREIMKSNIKVLVIDNDESLTNEVVKYFSGHEVIEVVACKRDGDEGLEYIIDYASRFDVLIMDLLLPKCDGIFILNEMQRRKINKNVIITTSFKEDAMLKEVNKCGVNYYMLKPINLSSLERRILSFDYDDKTSSNGNLQTIISDLLHTLGVPTHIRGYQFIRDGITIIYNNDSISYVTKDVYPTIAEKYETTPSRVERAIRHAIEISWTRGDIDVMTDIFGNSLDLDRDKPTNSEYLTTLADRIKLTHELVFV